MCEPGGVTIEYYHGQPLGILLAALRSDQGPNKSTGLAKAVIVGLDGRLVVERPATLYLRINDSAGRLDDNAGTATVEITRQ